MRSCIVKLLTAQLEFYKTVSFFELVLSKYWNVNMSMNTSINTVIEGYFSRLLHASFQESISVFVLIYTLN